MLVGLFPFGARLGARLPGPRAARSRVDGRDAQRRSARASGSTCRRWRRDSGAASRSPSAPAPAASAVDRAVRAGLRPHQRGALGRGRRRVWISRSRWLGSAAVPRIWQTPCGGPPPCTGCGATWTAPSHSWTRRPPSSPAPATHGLPRSGWTSDGWLPSAACWVMREQAWTRSRDAAGDPKLRPPGNAWHGFNLAWADLRDGRRPEGRAALDGTDRRGPGRPRSVRGGPRVSLPSPRRTGRTATTQTARARASREPWSCWSAGASGCTRARRAASSAWWRRAPATSAAAEGHAGRSRRRSWSTRQGRATSPSS